MDARGTTDVDGGSAAETDRAPETAGDSGASEASGAVKGKADRAPETAEGESGDGGSGASSSADQGSGRSSADEGSSESSSAGGDAERKAPRRPTLLGEFARVARTRPDWLYGLLCSWGLGYGFLAYLVLFTHPDLTHDPKPTVVLVVLSAIADGSLTNQLAAEPEWASGLLRAGEDPARILRVRNLMLFLCELFFVGTVVALVARLGHSDAWIPRALPQLAVLPLAPIAIGNISSVLVPTPFMRLSRRFQAPGTWVRWSIYVAIPFALSSLSLGLYLVPSRVEEHFQQRVVQKVDSLKHVTVTLASATHVYVAIWLVLIPLWQLGIWLLSLRIADGLARMRRHGLAKLMDRHTELADSLPDLSLYQSTRQLPERVREIPTDLRAELKVIGSELLEASTTFSRL